MTANGMDVARVNCAHDDPEVWDADDQERARDETAERPQAADRHGPRRPEAAHRFAAGGSTCRPHLSRAATASASSPRRRCCGSRPTPALPCRPARTIVPVDDAGWLERRRLGDRLELVDSRDASRHWMVVEVRADGCMVTATQTAYVTSGLELICVDGSRRRRRRHRRTAGGGAGPPRRRR